MKNVFKDIIKPVLVLASICLVISALLAYINSVTAPVIKKAEEEAAQQAMTEVMPKADGFESVELKSMPERVTEAYKATNGAGYVFMLTTKGYGGDMNLICGINSDGTIEACKTLSHNETSGLGSKTAEDPYRSQYNGISADELDKVDSISGATISSVAYKKAVNDAFAAFEAIKEAQ